MARILVTEEIAEGGLERLRRAGHEVVVEPDLARLPEAILGAHALIIRSATTVTAEVLDRAHDLVVVGRAGIGLDNVDVAAATKRGVMVVNAPQSNIVSAAEHTMALLLSQARNVPQAHAALKAGRWERSKWEGVELADKTLGIVGYGNIGSQLSNLAEGMGMRVIYHDVTDKLRHGNTEPAGTLEELLDQSDVVSLHVPLTEETRHLVDRTALARMKRSVSAPIGSPFSAARLMILSSMSVMLRT